MLCLFMDCSFFYSITFLFHGCNVFHYLLEHVLCVCVRSILLPAVLFSSNLFRFLFVVLVPIFWVRIFSDGWQCAFVNCYLRVRDKIADLEALRPYVEHVDCELKYKIIMLEVSWEAHVINVSGSFPWAAQIP